MTAILSALRRLGVGFIYGVGFLVGVALAAMIVMTVGVSIFSPQSGARMSLGPKTFEGSTRSDKFVFSNTNMVRSDWGRVTVLGTVENQGDATDHYVQLNADLFDKAGKFIYQCQTQLHEGMRASETANFMIECYSAPKELMSNVDSFKVYVRTP